MTPLVSIVVATYNRSAVLALALDTALRQTMPDFELIVVGDACTDDSEAVVTGLGDPRVRWINRAVNAGEQSVPNNEGVALARGRFIAFLNHDDLWWSDHLERLLSVEADFAFALQVVLGARGSRMTNVSATGLWEPHLFAPASGWLVRRELVQRVGPWRPAAQLRTAPSEDWLLRASRAGARMAQPPTLTLLVLPSGTRPGSYAEHAGADEHAGWHARLVTGPEALRAELMTAVAMDVAAAQRPRTLRVNLVRTAKDAGRRAAIAAGFTPSQLWHLLRHRRRGAFIAELRRIRGLDL